MLKKNVKILILGLLLFNTSYAANNQEDTLAENNDYEANYYEDEGRLLFKVKAQWLPNLSSAAKGLRAPDKADAHNAGKLLSSGIGLESSTAIFFNDNIAAELSLGIAGIQVNLPHISAIHNNYNATSAQDLVLSKKGNYIYLIPVSITGQFHIAPFGAIRPYVGAGYHGAYIFTPSKYLKVGNGHGPVLQLGVDLVARDDTLITLDVKQYFLDPKVTYKNVQNVSGTVKINPLNISVGIGFKL